MNQPFMFMPNMNPLADNAIFIKKSIKRKYTVFIAAAVAAVLIATMFGILYSFGLSANGAEFYVSSYDQEMQGAELSGLGFRLIIMTGIFVLPAIAAVNYSVAARDKENRWFPVSVPNLGRAFFIMYMLMCIYVLFSSLGNIGLYELMAQMGEMTRDANLLTDVFIPRTVPAILGIIWSIGGLVFISSFNKTVRCLRLTDKGSGFFGIMSLIIILANIAVAVYYNVNGFKGGFFFSLQGTETLSIAINQNTVAKMCFNLFFIGAVTALFMVMLFSTEFSKAVKKARLSLQSEGANPYITDGGVNAAYYQSFYNGQPAYGQPVPPVQPPVPVNMNYPQPPFQGNIPPMQNVNNYPIHQENNIPASQPVNPQVNNVPVYPAAQPVDPQVNNVPVYPAAQPVDPQVNNVPVYPAVQPVDPQVNNAPVYPVDINKPVTEQENISEQMTDEQNIPSEQSYNDFAPADDEILTENNSADLTEPYISADEEQLAPMPEEKPEETVICRAYGCQNPVYSRFCIECGNKLGE